MTFTDEEFSKFSEILESLSIRHPNPSPSDQEYVTLKEGISKGILQQFFRSQYHKDDNVVEFIPKYIRPIIDHPWFFYKPEARPTERHPEEEKTNPVETAGFEHESLVQKKFASLGSSLLFSGNKITIFHNMKKDFLNFDELEPFMIKEYDLVVFDAKHGVFLVEIKKSKHENFLRKSRKKELATQQKRMEYLCLIKNFLGVETPINAVILTSLTENPNKDPLLKYDSNSYVLGVNFGENFDETWKSFLDRLTLPTVSQDDIEKFAVTLNTLLHFGDTPFHLHKNLTGGSITTPGIYQQTKKKNIVIWTKQQSEIIDLIQDTLSKNATEFAAGPCQTTLKLVISGCYGSGKTLMLYEAAKLFCRENKEKSVENDGRRVAYVIYDRKDPFYKEGDMSLLHKRLKASFEDEELTKGKVSVFNLAGYKQSNICCLVGYIQSLDTVDLILIDEFLLFNEHSSDSGKRLICDDHSMTNIIFTTLDNTDYNNLWKVVFEDFKILQLNGNLRSCPSICKYISVNPGASSSGEVGYNPRPTTVDHNVTGGIVEVINLESNADLSQVTDKIKSILETEKKETEKKEKKEKKEEEGKETDRKEKTDKKDNIFVINNKSGESIDNKLIAELKSLGVEYGDFKKFIGCEAATVIYIGREVYDFNRDEALSRATVNLILFLYPG